MTTGPMQPSELIPEIREAFERCRRRFPAIGLPFNSFCSRLEEILSGSHAEHVPAPEETIGEKGCPSCIAICRQLHHEDLFLALSCSVGDRVAWACFTEEYFALLKRMCERACRDFTAAEDLAQELIAALLDRSGPASGRDQAASGAPSAGDADRKPAQRGKLYSYNGRGSLAGWLRVAVAHAAVDRFRRSRREVSLDQLIDQQGPIAAEPAGQEVEAEDRLDAHWGPLLARALLEEIAALEPRDRLLLKLYYLQDVPLKLIGGRFGVHEATASRWLERVRQGVRKRVEQTLRRRHGLRPRDLGQLWLRLAETGNGFLEAGLQDEPASIRSRKNMQDTTA